MMTKMIDTGPGLPDRLGVTVKAMRDAIGGSSQVFMQPDRNPMRSVNFITAHDGFTLNDLVSYNEKHTGANGEDNRHGVHLQQPDWGDQSHSITFELFTPNGDDEYEQFYIALNAYRKPLNFQLPDLPAEWCWARLVDRSQTSPLDFADPTILLEENQKKYPLTTRSVVVLIAQNKSQGGTTI